MRRSPAPSYRGVGRWCCGVWARVSEGGGATVVGCEDSRVRADYTIWRVRTACVGLVFTGLLEWVRGVGEAENKICMVRA